ncbi:molecular chaperone HtpG [Stackebrandtia endophytica]|uniref:Molecular chaperone HtpG n=1 Tax=Stackebrandtia endophytica TaxID=1496996 RepID=A0A543ATI1_9ACTN|nr:HSP90 family protein [Stackebrandtia endophytica]TQL75878.1 molecular chaperone HtpG [Stackebrandtia endophytica]
MTPEPPSSAERFQVDLRGVVEILSRHLYSSPRVFVRELIQNARDAIAARALHEGAGADGDPLGGRGIQIRVDGDDIVVSDDGLGLTGEEMRSLLATIGASSKREDLERVREDFLGRFGIGLLSCFLVADTIEVVSRSARTVDAPTMRWTGRSDGTYAISDSDEVLPAPGTRVRVRLRPEEVMWASPRRLTTLARDFARYLDVPVTVIDDSGAPVQISLRPAPEDLRPDEAAELCRTVFGFNPLSTLRLDIPMLGVRGLAYITPHRESTTGRAGDLVYSRGLLVAEDNTQLAPDWAYFARLILDAGSLPLTASRESFQETALTIEAAKQIGTMLRSHIVDLSRAHPDTFRRFVTAHSVGLRAMALDDPTMFRFVYDHVPFVTSRGERTLADLLDGTDSEPGTRVLHQSYTQRQFDALAPLANAQGVTVVDSSHVHEPQILQRLVEIRPEVRLETLSLSVLVAGADSPTDRELAQTVERAARMALPGQDIQVVDFGTEALVGLELPADDGWRPHSERNGGKASGWGAIFDEFSSTEEPRGPQLVLNVCSPLVRSLGEPLPAHVRTHVANTLRVLAVLHSGAPLLSHDHVILADSVAALVKTATETTGRGPR